MLEVFVYSIYFYFVVVFFLFQGNNCEVNIDECGSDPCQNGGTCQDGENGYRFSILPSISCLQFGNDFCYQFTCNRCRCPAGYEGNYCQLDVSVCREQHANDVLMLSTTTCQNGGRCLDGPGLDYQCLCPEG